MPTISTKQDAQHRRRLYRRAAVSNARLLSRYIAKHIPGKPNVIVTNMPGAASQTAVQYLDATAPRDGTAIVMLNLGLITDSLLIAARVKIDFRKYNWIGSVGMDIALCYMWGATGAKTLDDAKKIPFVHMGLTSVGTSTDIN
jgi:tripartite-type tricarboxylate transporter receptor subunit TctC